MPLQAAFCPMWRIFEMTESLAVIGQSNHGILGQR
jgi:hypothetical protein